MFFIPKTQISSFFFFLQDLDKIISAEFAAQFKKLFNVSQTENNPKYYGLPEEILVPENHGTAHVAVVSSNGDAVSATSSLNY